MGDQNYYTVMDTAISDEFSALALLLAPDGHEGKLSG